MYDISLQQIYFFIGVAEHRCISDAARALLYSQPTISRGITRLEEGLGVKLFRRYQTGVELTECGNYLYTEWRPLVDRLRHSMMQAQHIVPAKERTLSIQCCDTPEVRRTVKEAARAYGERYPEVSVGIELYEHREMMRRVLVGNIDLAFTFTLPIPEFPVPKTSVPFRFWKIDKISAVTVKSLGTYVLMSADNPLASSAELSLSDFHDETFILPSHFGIDDELTCRLAFLPPVEDPYGPIAECKRAGFYPKWIKYVANTATLMNEVENNSGVTIIGDFMGDRMPDGIKRLALDEPLEDHYVIAVWRTGQLSEDAQNFIDMLPKIE